MNCRSASGASSRWRMGEARRGEADSFRVIWLGLGERPRKLGRPWAARSTVHRHGAVCTVHASYPPVVCAALASRAAHSVRLGVLLMSFGLRYFALDTSGHLLTVSQPIQFTSAYTLDRLLFTKVIKTCLQTLSSLSCT